MAVNHHIRKAARIIRDGGVVAYPTEGVFGLGCRPDNGEAVGRILRIKNRDINMGLVLIVANPLQLFDWIDVPIGTLNLETNINQPVTWILPATDEVPVWIRGSHAGIAVRQTAHPVARALCEHAGSALVSTSANFSGQPPARNIHVLRRQFTRLVDFIVPGFCGPASGPSQIRDWQTGKVLRPA